MTTPIEPVSDTLSYDEAMKITGQARVLLYGAGLNKVADGLGDVETLLFSAQTAPAEVVGEPVAWLIKDFADGWFAVSHIVDMQFYEEVGHAVKPLFEHQPTQAEAREAGIREALTPSAETKAAYMGEFWFERTYADDDGNEMAERVYVPWTTIKEIMKAISLRVLLKEGDRHE